MPLLGFIGVQTSEEAPLGECGSWAVQMNDLLCVVLRSGFRHTALHPYPHNRVHFWGGNPPPRYLGWKVVKKIFFEEGWDSGGDVRGQDYEKWGKTSLLIRSYLTW